jgi:S1-C subfamily serine protease
MDNNLKKFFISTLVITIVISSLAGGAMGFWAGSGAINFDNFSGFSAMKNFMMGGRADLNNTQDLNSNKVVTIKEESAVIETVEKVSPAVVSIIVSKDLPKIEQYFSQPFGSDLFRQFFGDDFDFGPQVPQYRQNGTEKTEVGGGTGFILTSDGIIVTNKHVVTDEQAEYTVLMNNEKKYPAKVLARDSVNDMAVLKIEEKNLPTVELGDSSKLKVGQSVIAIGNALGEFRNTVSTGVISGLSRSITAGGAGIGTENLSGVIQTDASINQGNSGGPLLNIAGQVIGINTAIAQGAQNIGFAIPINEVKNSIDSVKKTGKISRPWLGVRYAIINPEIAKANNLSVDYGALIVRGDAKTDMAVIPGSPADKAGLVENNIILEVNGQKITEDNSLVKLLSRFKAGDQITLKVLDKGEKKDVRVKLEEAK